MYTRPLSGIVLTLVLTSILTLAFNIQPIQPIHSSVGGHSAGHTESSAAASPAPVVAVNPVNSTAEPSGNFTINFTITDAVNLYQWSFELRWDEPMLLDIKKENITEGPFLKNGGTTIFSKVAFTFPGYITASCSLQGPPGPNPWDPHPQNGSGVLASAAFTVEGPGRHALELRDVRLKCWNYSSESLYEVVPDVVNGAFYTTQPYARFAYAPNPSEEGNYGRPIVGEPVTFNASLSYDPDQPYTGQPGAGIVNYEWDFDDGNTTTVVMPIVTHTYAVEDDYIVTLTVTDDDGQSRGWQHLVKINLHDIAVIDVTAVTTEVLPGEIMEVNATVLNEGNFQEALNVTLCVDGFPVNTTRFTWYWWHETWWGGYWVLDTMLSMGENGTTTIRWNTTGSPGGVYTVSVNASLVHPRTRESVAYLEQDWADNRLEDGEVTIGRYDIAIVNVTSSPTVATIGDPVAVNVTVLNEGTYTETFNVTAHYNAHEIGTERDVVLDCATATTLTFIWDTTDAEEGTYTISASASPVPNEKDTADNWLTDGTVTLTHKRLQITTSGELDYMPHEAINIRIAALVTDAHTREAVSDANVTLRIYNPDGALWITEHMIEQPSGTGIYQWASPETVRAMEMPDKKGVYVAHIEASYKGGPASSDILEFHIDPLPEDGNNPLPMIVGGSLTGIALLALALLYLTKRRK